MKHEFWFLPVQKPAIESEKSKLRLLPHIERIPKQILHWAVEKACRFESERCLQSPFFEQAFLGYFFGRLQKSICRLHKAKAD